MRMAQLKSNSQLISAYASHGAAAGFDGLFCVVSDPVDLLCQAALQAGAGGLRPTQLMGLGLGVMQARAAYYAQKDGRPALARFPQEGRSFGPHGQGLVVANSISDYDDALSQELTAQALHANLYLREVGFKPYVAPALSSGALSLLAALQGRWHYSSTYLDGVFFGCRNRRTALGPEVEQQPLPDALWARLQATEQLLRNIM